MIGVGAGGRETNGNREREREEEEEREKKNDTRKKGKAYFFLSSLGSRNIISDAPLPAILACDTWLWIICSSSVSDSDTTENWEVDGCGDEIGNCAFSSSVVFLQQPQNLNLEIMIYSKTCINHIDWDMIILDTTSRSEDIQLIPFLSCKLPDSHSLMKSKVLNRLLSRVFTL